jgi:hypothetical protein
MPREKSTLPGGVRTADLALLGVLCEHIPADEVAMAICESGRQGERNRLLPAEMTVLYVVALSLYRDVAYEEVLSCVLEGWRWLNLATPAVATKGAITQARVRLGKDALKNLFERLAQPISKPQTKGAWFKSWLTVAIDGSTLTVPDSKANADAFGYAGDPTRASYPLIRCACLVETGTHAGFAAAVGSYKTSEIELGRRLVRALKPGMLLLADRGYLSFDFWEECLVTGADLLWRVNRTWPLTRLQTLEDGSWLSTIRPGVKGDKTKSRTVRVVQYSVEGSDETYRLVTSILDPEQASALDLAQVYTQRWEIESVFDEMKTHLRGARMLLRSKTPDLVEQEFWGLMIAHRAIRGLMHEAAIAHNKDPDELSFVSAVRIVKRTLPSRASFPP